MMLAAGIALAERRRWKATAHKGRSIGKNLLKSLRAMD
jgi:hypothetical protein